MSGRVDVCNALATAIGSRPLHLTGSDATLVFCAHFVLTRVHSGPTHFVLTPVHPGPTFRSITHHKLAPSEARLTLEFFLNRLLENKEFLVDM